MQIVHTDKKDFTLSIFGDRPRETSHLCALCLSASLREKIRGDPMNAAGTHLMKPLK